MGWLLQEAADRLDAAYQPRPGEYWKARVGVQVKCLFGQFHLQRDYYHHAGKGKGHYPADAGLGLEAGHTPALTRLICLEGADETSYQKAELHMQETGGIAVSARQIQRLIQRLGPAAQRWQARGVEPAECESQPVPVLYVSADGTGTPMRKEALEGRTGKQADGSAKTRQVYLGCVFTQHRVDDDGHPVRDWESTSYVSSLERIEEFGPMLRREALRRGLGKAHQVVLLVDGAAGLEKMGRSCFRGCIQIVDFYHAVEHAGVVLQVLLRNKEHPEYRPRLRRWAKRLLRNGVTNLIAETREDPRAQGVAEALEDALHYFVENVERMQYGNFRRKGFFIGSGVVEAGCRTVIGSRCKQSGMFWSVPGAENILAFRCIQSSRRLADFWRHRLNDHAARNDALRLAA